MYSSLNLIIAVLILSAFIFIFVWFRKRRLSENNQNCQIHIILDFDGVLANSWQVYLSGVNYALNELNISPVSDTEAREITTRELLQKCRIGFFRQCSLVRKVKSYIGKRREMIGIFRDFSSACEDIEKHKGILFSIISSNSKENIEAFLDSHGVHFVSNIVSDSALFGKERQIRNFLKSHKINPELCLYVGDEVRDIEAAKKSGIRSLAVTWGYDSVIKLRESKPTYLACNAHEATSVIQSFVLEKETV